MIIKCILSLFDSYYRSPPIFIWFFYLVNFDRLFDKIIDFEWSNAPLDWEIKFWNFIFPSHELIIDLEIVIRSFFDIAQIDQRRKKRSSQNIHIRQNIHIIHYVNVKCPFSPFRTLNSDFALPRKFRNFSRFFITLDDENFVGQWWKFLSYLKSDQ